jgi:site-specific DNA-methyltransferase (adenine-specific)
MKQNYIHNQDCLDTMKEMDDSSVDLVITSPPYNMNLRITNGRYHSRQVTKELSTKYSNFSDNMPIEDFYNFHLKVLEELIRVSNIVFYNIQIVTGSKRAFFKIIGEMNEFLKDIIVWDKTHGQPAIGKQVLNRQSELLLIFEKDYPISRQFRKTGYFDRGTLTDMWSIPRAYQKSNKNGAVFPEELVEKVLINFTKEGDLVYDPFFGTGTTGAVAKKMGRRYIGSEISKEYVKIARDRIKKIKT